jgi:N6-L-threonylcarbamoyladenine synthase
MLVYVKDLCQYEIMGNTLDDAAGEAFDKIAKFLNIGFPGGPAIDRLSLRGSRTAFDLPRPMVRNRSLDFSFSGLKTCVVNMFRGRQQDTIPLPDVAASFQEAIVDVLVSKALQAAERKGVAAISVTGGVSSNRRLRESFRETCGRLGLEVFFPLPELRTDNAAMVAAAGAARLERGEVSGLDLNAVPTAPLESAR